MRKLLLLTAFILACAATSLAQSTDYNKVEFYGGYSYNSVDNNNQPDPDPVINSQFTDRTGFNGFETSIKGNITRYIGIKGDFSGHYNTRTFSFGVVPPFDVHSSLYNVLGGIEIKDNSTEARFKPFVHALVGIAHARTRTNSNLTVDITDSDTGLSGAFGGGLDIRASQRIDIRVITADYNPTRVFGETTNNFRIGAGIVIH